MNFTISRFAENGLELVSIRDAITGTTVSILPQYGAILHRFSVLNEGESLNIIDNYSGREDVQANLARWYKSTKLSPFVCRIANGKYRFEGKEFEFQNKFPDGSAIHGLLYNKNFKITDEFADDNSGAVSLRYHYKKDDPAYPFDYVCEIRYTLHSGSSLQVETTILNLDDATIPLADGWHPYFRLGNKVDDYILQFNSASMLEFDENLIPTGKTVEEASFQVPHRIGERTLDNCFIVDFQESVPCCVLHNPNNKLSLSFYTSPNYRYLQIFTPEHRNSIAIENLSAAPDAFNNGMGLLKLPPRRSETFNVWYTVSRSE
jgi:aldose 1-epimerase